MREDVDIGSLVINDLQRKSHCEHIRLDEMVDVMFTLKYIQINLIYYGFGLRKLIDDIAPNVPNTLSLMGEFPQMP